MRFARIYLLLALGLLSLFCQCQPEPTSKASTATLQSIASFEGVETGDIIFHTSTSDQSKFISLATHSPYTHVGVIYRRQSHALVFEAVQPVKVTPLKEWIERGVDEFYIIKRLRNPEEVFTSENLKKIETWGQQQLGKNYDLLFEWSNDRMYCSELVWKMYKEVLGIQLGDLRKMGDYDLKDPSVQKQIAERWSIKFNANQMMIAPSDIFEDPQLIEVKRGNSFN